MILVTSPTKPFSYNAKGYPRRPVAMALYSEEINTAYTEVHRSSQASMEGPSTWNDQTVQAFVRTVVDSVMSKSIPDDADLFQNGCDRYVGHRRPHLFLFADFTTA